MVFFCGTTRGPRVAWRKRGDRVLISFFGEDLILVKVTTVVMKVRRAKARGKVKCRKENRG